MAFAAPVAFTYNPLVYARAMHVQFIETFVHGPVDVLFVGMNPGPFGMAQTGVPFGQVAAVTTWMGLRAPVLKPPREHPKRPISGLACTKSEVSGARLWGAVAARHPRAQDFFAHHFVVNYCPLLFMDEGGRNLTPDKLPRAEREPLQRACDAHLQSVVDALQPRWIVGVGGWAAKCALRANGAHQVGTLPHPSPASPQANRGWQALAQRALHTLGVNDAL